jgi:hypothetical protein
MALTLVAVKLTPTELRAVDDAVVRVGCKSRSDLLRQAIIAFIRGEGLDDETLLDIKQERLFHPLRERKKTEEVPEQDPETAARHAAIVAELPWVAFRDGHPTTVDLGETGALEVDRRFGTRWFEATVKRGFEDWTGRDPACLKPNSWQIAEALSMWLGVKVTFEGVTHDTRGNASFALSIGAFIPIMENQEVPTEAQAHALAEIRGHKGNDGWLHVGTSVGQALERIGLVESRPDPQGPRGRYQFRAVAVPGSPWLGSAAARSQKEGA